MANSKFDLSLLTPADEDESSFKKNLTPLTDDVNENDEGAYLDTLPKAPGFFAKLPRNILIGLSKLGHDTLNSPHDFVASLENSMNQFGEKSIPKNLTVPTYQSVKVSDYIPKQQDYDFASMLGQKGDATLIDKLIQGGVQYLPEILGGRRLLQEGIGRLTGTHQLKTVEEAAKKYGMNNFAYTPQTVEQARKYMPKTEAAKQLFEKSQAGEYPASFSLRSQLGKHQRDLATSPLASERLLAPEIGDLRQSMVSQLQDALRQQGMHVEADMLRNGIKNYAQYVRVKNAVMPIIKKLGIPTTIAATIGFGYQKGKKMVKD